MEEIVASHVESEPETDIKPVEAVMPQENQIAKPASQQNLTDKERTARALALQVAQETEQARKDEPEPVKDIESGKIDENQVKLDETEIEAEKIRQSELDIRVKLYLTQQIEKRTFEKIKDRFIDIFPQIEDDTQI